MERQNDFGVTQQLFTINIETIKKQLKLSSVQKQIENLRNINRWLDDQKNVVEKQSKNRTKWKELLQDNYVLNFNILRQNVKDDLIIEKFFSAYELTSKILQDLKIIRPITNVVSFIDEDYNYTRVSENFSFNTEYLSLDLKKGDYYGLRLKESAFKTQIQEAKQKQEYDAINQHFKNFITPFTEYEKNNKTGWKINKGVLAETFQRHWESKPHHLNQLIDDFESEGARWLLYRDSSGSDPYFIGPDTDIAQVKNTNASLVSNLNTIINSIKGVLQIVDSIDNDTKIEEKIKKIFQQKQIKHTITSKIWDGIDDRIRKEIQDIEENLEIRKAK